MDIDSEKQAEQLAQIFANLSAAVDRYRFDHWATITDDKRQQLKIQAQVLAMRSQQCTADALGSILLSIQPHLPNIEKATQDAQDTLATLKDVAKALAIVDAAVSLVYSIAACDLGSLGSGLDGLTRAIEG
ncbi:MAG: hypothetical protein WDO73_09805 [Ignavibacteriota bacterium]